MSWFDLSKIGKMQLEISNYCNAECPGCDRDYIKKLKEDNLNNSFITLDLVKKTFFKGKWNSLDEIYFCGNVDEPTTNPQLIDIIKYFKTITDNKLRTVISSNGGTRTEKFWTELGNLSKNENVVVVFAIDGLEDTNHLYRKNVKWKKVKSNWRTFIQAGGIAHWQYIPFPWNTHQIEKAEKISKDEGFKVFFTKKNYHIKERVNFNYSGRIDDSGKVGNFKTPKCKALPGNGKGEFHDIHGNLYISSQGYVYPCCWYGTKQDTESLWKNSKIDKKYHNINFYSLDEILKGPIFKWIECNMVTQKVCNKKCK